MDAKGLFALANEMKRGGNLFAKFKVSRIRGVDYVIIEGYAGLRRHLTGTKYLANNPKVISFGIGKQGINNAIKQGFVLSILISAGFHAADQLINDQLTWHYFIGGLAIDLAIAVSASGIAWATVATIVGTSAATCAVGPLIALVVVGGIVAYGTAKLVNSDNLSKEIAEGLIYLEKLIKNDIQPFNQIVRSTKSNDYENPADFIARLFSIPQVKIGKQFNDQQ